MSKLYVGNISYNTTEESLKEAFGGDGRTVVGAQVIKDRETGRSRGFAFVEMSSPADASAALSAMDGYSLDGREIRVSEARERQPRGAGGGGRDFGGGGGGGRDFGGGGGRDFGGGGPPPPSGDNDRGRGRGKRDGKRRGRDRGGDY